MKKNGNLDDFGTFLDSSSQTQTSSNYYADESDEETIEKTHTTLRDVLDTPLLKICCYNL